MSGKTVLDSGVIAAIFFPEDLTATAIKKNNLDALHHGGSCIGGGGKCCCETDFIRGDTPGDVKIMLDDATMFIQDLSETIPSGALIPPALDLACELNISLYDALFVAAAVRHRATLFTADIELSAAARKACNVMLLE